MQSLRSRPSTGTRPSISHNTRPTVCRAAAAAPVAEVDPVAAPTGYEHAVLLQGFGWDSSTKDHFYAKVKSHLGDMQETGITHVWLPPPSNSVSPQGYMPGQLYNLTSEYGTQEELVDLLKCIKEKGMLPLADIVINHRCADEKSHDGDDAVYNNFKDDVDHDGKRIDWDSWAITGDDPNFQGTGNPDSGEDYPPAPDLDHHNKELRAALVDWMRWLQKDIGFAGWRFDFVKGFAPEYTREYVEKTVGASVLNVGEYWADLGYEDGNLSTNQDPARQLLADWVKASGIPLFDFTLKGVLQEAVKNTQYYRLKDGAGKAPGLAGWWPSKAVTFISNHDTDSTQGHWPFPVEDLAMGNAYIITHPGIPCVFWDHFKNDDGIIKSLLALRKKHGINSRSNLEILCAEDDMYVGRIDNKLVLKLGPRHEVGEHTPAEAEGWTIAMSGKDYAIWEKV